MKVWTDPAGSRLVAADSCCDEKIVHQPESVVAIPEWLPSGEVRRCDGADDDIHDAQDNSRAY